MSHFRNFLALAIAVVLIGCAHPIVIGPTQTPARYSESLINKNVAYVMSESDRSKEVTTDGGGGDSVRYFPYRDLEKGIRDALRAVYADVYVIRSAKDSSAIKSGNISYIFIPEISTSSSSSSIFTWPPTKFNIEMSCDVTDADGNLVSRIQAKGAGAAEFSEFIPEFGLAGRRAANDLSENFKQAVSADQKIR